MDNMEKNQIFLTEVKNATLQNKKNSTKKEFDEKHNEYIKKLVQKRSEMENMKKSIKEREERLKNIKSNPDIKKKLDDQLIKHKDRLAKKINKHPVFQVETWKNVPPSNKLSINISYDKYKADRHKVVFSEEELERKINSLKDELSKKTTISPTEKNILGNKIRKLLTIQLNTLREKIKKLDQKLMDKDKDTLLKKIEELKILTQGKINVNNLTYKIEELNQKLIPIKKNTSKIKPVSSSFKNIVKKYAKQGNSEQTSKMVKIREQKPISTDFYNKNYLNKVGGKIPKRINQRIPSESLKITKNFFERLYKGGLREREN